MQSNKRLFLLLAVLALLGLGTWWLTRRADTANSTLDVAATSFSVVDTAAVDKIFVANRTGEQHTLTREARNYWRLDNRYDARIEQVRMLLTTLHRQRVKMPVPRAARNNVVRALASQGIKVEVYQKGQRTNTFYVAGSTNDRLGTYMILDGAEEPYIVHVPGFEGYLTTRYLLTPRFWRTNPVFQAPVGTIERIAVEALGQPERTFTVQRAGTGFVVADLPQADTALVRAYAAQFGRVFAQGPIDSAQRAYTDTVLRRPPNYRLTVTARNQPKPAQIRLWTIGGNKDSMLGVIAGDSAEPVIVQTYVFKPLLAFRREFVKKK